MRILATVRIVEAADRILPAVPQRLSAEVMQLLSKIGVDVRVGKTVASAALSPVD